jgi:hypothetical protein
VALGKFFSEFFGLPLPTYDDRGRLQVPKSRVFFNKKYTMDNVQKVCHFKNEDVFRDVAPCNLV